MQWLLSSELLGYKQVTAENEGLDAFTKLKENNIDLIICDIECPNGMEESSLMS